MKHIGETLRKEIDRRGLRQAEVARRYGCHRSNLQYFLRQETLDVHKYDKLCKAIGCSPMIAFDDCGCHTGITIGDITQNNNGVASVNVNESTIKMMAALIETKDRLNMELTERLNDKEKIISMLMKLVDPEKLVGLGL